MSYLKLGTAILFLGSISTASFADTVFVNQGSEWTNGLRNAFYTQDQGSRIMPLTWMRALKQQSGEPFLGDALARYGYLPMSGRSDADLPVGFSTNDFGGTQAVGMTCAACHVREIDVNGTAYRIDGGPGIVDFQSLLKDLDDAVLAVLDDDAVFESFATDVLGTGASPSEKEALKADVTIWSNRFHTLVDRSLPTPSWAPARLDAVSMIFNRLAGLDIGPAEDDFLIPDNIQVADAPTRYPFLWNAARQDFTQWPGFAANGNDLLGLARNLGEVYGVFGEFHPTKKSGILFDYDFVTDNSANWDGLKSLEDWIWDIGAPQWPWSIDQNLVDQGKEIFNLETADGGCVECHGKKKGKFRSLEHTTFATPVLDVGTDTRECQILTRQVDTGVLEGAKIPIVGHELGAQASAFDVLSVSVANAIIQHATSFRSDSEDTTGFAMSADALAGDDDFLNRFNDLTKAFPLPDDVANLAVSTGSGCKYEARVLDGIWAAAPYLHNGSVPTLTELLKEPADRVANFTPGPEYDIDAVGMAVEQTKFDQVIETTGCDDLNSGNSRCGHDYGTQLSEDHKKALLEYLKSI
ncbi:MAG: di-heme-cytochrome C peroxidase [Pelagimonas sp.]|uniref:di-heme-cytochrome C peroxidase n=1 Tax=Pelagimonas sp. TaxID=2073170 RepID=UPI003D6AF3BD